MDIGSSGRRTSEDDKKSLSSSFSDGTSKFFTSMIAKKNGLFSDMSSKFDSLMKSGASSSASSENSSPTSSPPPRTPPPRPPPITNTHRSLSFGKGMKERENVATKMSFRDSRHPQRAGSLSGFSDTSSVDDQFTMDGMNVSFDEPLYNQREVPVGQSSDNVARSDNGRPERRVIPVAASDSRDETGYGDSEGPSASVSPPNSQNSEIRSEHRKAPKLTTKRRSSTVDEMLFDDYVELETNGDSVFSDQVTAPAGDLMSFDHEDTERRGKHPSQSSVESSEPEYDTHNYAMTSVDSSDAEFGGVQLHRSQSMGSEKSWSSNYSVDSQPDEITLECMEFMKSFVDKMFNINLDISQTEKAKFGELCQHAPGRLWFARYVNSQRVHNKKVDEQIFFRMVQFFAVCLFECNEAEDFSPAKTLMNMCFTFFHETGQQLNKSFLYSYLRDQPIWQSLRFWNAAFFDAVQCERSRRPMPTIEAPKDARTDDRHFQENITFGQLGTFTCNMRAFGLGKDLCLEFVRKQSIIANLREEQVQMLRDNVEKSKEH
ncbi:uncharacterized protein KIAA0513-like [Haliotis rufescens]|uniref:uncharacterized protein KIAA0513-like n=1 Tax=Haliotis rufescens TaxID=6454 RepID=UPI001EB089B9|nr:uncharacterized protein KIAA0513-like [Haliotis rufescens]